MLSHKTQRFKGGLITRDKMPARLRKAGSQTEYEPSFFLLYKGFKAAVYKGKVELEQIKQWITRKLGLPGPNSVIKSHNQLQEAVRGTRHVVIYLGPVLESVNSRK